MISFSQAQENLLKLCTEWLEDQAPQTERVPLPLALNRFLAGGVLANLDLPQTDVSAMDGYAMATLSPAGAVAGEHYQLVGESRAGEPYSGKDLTPGECVRIFTGAVVPNSASTVVIQENVDREGESAVAVNETAALQANIRRRGEEISAGAGLASEGQRITANMIPLLASQGITDIEVHKKLRVAFLATGDELRAAGEVLRPGDIYESNLASIEAVLSHYPVELMNLGVVEDRPEAITKCLREAAERADVVISSGGVSVGDYDFVRQCVESMGRLTDYKVAMKPGKPVCFGHIDSADNDKSSDGCALFFGLPGNAVSSFVVLTELYLPVLRLMMNRDRIEPNTQLMAVLDSEVNRRAGRLEFQRGILRSEPSDAGGLAWKVSAFGTQDSHRVLGLARANCTIQIPADVSHISAGTEVRVSVFPWTHSFE